VVWLGASGDSVRAGQMGGQKIHASGKAQGADLDGGDRSRDIDVWILLRRLCDDRALVVRLAGEFVVRAVSAGGRVIGALLPARAAKIGSCCAQHDRA